MTRVESYFFSGSHATLAEGNPMRTLILRIDAPLMEGVDLGQHDEPDTEAIQ